MVRFARAEGSKASNKRIPEEATSWSELKRPPVVTSAMLAQKNKKSKKASKKSDESIHKNGNEINEKIVNEKRKNSELDESIDNNNISKKKKKKNLDNDVSCSDKDGNIQQADESMELPETPKQKKKKKKKNKDKLVDKENQIIQSDDFNNSITEEETSKCHKSVKEKAAAVSVSENADVKNAEENICVSDEANVNISEKPAKKKKKKNKNSIGENNEELEAKLSNVEDENESEKTSKKKKKNAEGVSEDNIDGNLDAIAPVTDETVAESAEDNDGDASSKKKKKRKHKKKKNADEEKAEEKKPEFKVDEAGRRVKTLKSGKMKTYFDLPYEEGERMTRFENFWIKREAVESLENKKKELAKEGLDSHHIMKQMMKAKRAAHKNLRLELILEQKSAVSDLSAVDRKIQRRLQRWNGTAEPKENNQEDEKPQKPKSDLNFEENDMMTNFDGFWVMRSSLPKLEAIKRRHTENVLAKRSDGDTSEELTENEKFLLQRLVKSVKRAEHRKLIIALYSQQSRQSGSNYDTGRQEQKPRPRTPGKYKNINYTELGEEIVKFDGFWVKKEGAERLNQLKVRLESEGVGEEELSKVLKLERRKEERVLKNEKKICCFNCRQPGHVSSACPDNNQGGHNICYKCGSLEHTSRECQSEKRDTFSHATCYICKKGGHIARQCPENTHGLYPKGGSCRGCGSIQHLVKDCPETEPGETPMTVSRLEKGAEIEQMEDDDVETSSLIPTVEEKAKKIVF